MGASSPDPPDLFDDPRWAEGCRPWYRFGWESPVILAARFRSGHRWWFRLRMAWQRVTRGYGDDDLWNLNDSIARLIVAGTREMREYGHSHPVDVDPDEWNGTLAVIERGFQDWIDCSGCFEGDAARRRFDDAMSNFSCWWADLWD